MSDNRMAFEAEVSAPIREREAKPRSSGLTMVLDQGLGVGQMRDLLDTAAYYIDNVQFTYGTCALYPENVLRDKIEMLRSADIDVTPGGALFQIAIWQHKADAFIRRARNLGFTVLEIYDWTGQMKERERAAVIERCISGGFRVISEVVLLDSWTVGMDSTIAADIQADLAAGAFTVIVPMYSKAGQQVLKDPAEHGIPPCKVMWEPPRGEGQQAHCERALIEVGPNANLIARDPRDVLSIEALRRGLKDGPMRTAFERCPDWPLEGSQAD